MGTFMGTFSSFRLISRAIAFLIEKRLIVRASSNKEGYWAKKEGRSLQTFNANLQYVKKCKIRDLETPQTVHFARFAPFLEVLFCTF